jgi:hypothetical protein
MLVHFSEDDRKLLEGSQWDSWNNILFQRQCKYKPVFVINKHFANFFATVLNTFCKKALINRPLI